MQANGTATGCSHGSIFWGRDIAEVYDATYSAQFAPSVLNPIVDLLTELAGQGPALEFAVGTGRVAITLSARGISVHRIELSPHMVEQLRSKPGAETVPVTIGDMTIARVPGTFKLVYLVANTIMNVTTQEEPLKAQTELQFTRPDVMIQTMAFAQFRLGLNSSGFERPSLPHEFLYISGFSLGFLGSSLQHRVQKCPVGSTTSFSTS